MAALFYDMNHMSYGSLIKTSNNIRTNSSERFQQTLWVLDLGPSMRWKYFINILICSSEWRSAFYLSIGSHCTFGSVFWLPLDLSA